MENEEISLADPSQLLEAASDFAHYPGVQNDDVAKEFLDRFPLPLIINVLQTRADVPGLESALVACLERIFKTRYGAFLIPHYMPFVQVGLQADSQAVRGLACKTVACLLDNFYEKPISGAQLIIDNSIYPLLLDCVINGNEQVANASTEAITKLAASPKGMEIIFLTNNDDTNLVNLSARCSSLGHVRVLSLIVKLFSVSLNVASAVCNTNLLSLLEEEVKNSDDTLVTLSVLELFYELAEVQHGGEFLSRTSLVQLLSSIICNTSVDGMLRSRAMMISGRLLYNENIYTLLDESSVGSIILAITSRFELDSQDPNECESALEALGQIGSSFPGATLLLSIAPPPARFVIEAAFDRQSHGKQLAALHSLGNITGEPRPESSVVLSNNAEENLRRLIYETASRSSKLTPSGLLLSILKQDAEVRLAAYRVITGLVARQWFLMEICSKQDIVDILTYPNTESTKIGMEGKYKCCKAAHDAFMSTTKLSSNPALTAIASKLQEAVSRGPYLGGKNQREAQPVVMTQERF